jgi:alpha-mannosidase
VECRIVLDWRQPRRVLKLAYPLALDTPIVTAESPYGFSEWPADGEEHPCQKWVDVSDRSGTAPAGLALLNDCKYGFDCRGSELRLTLLRTPAYAHHDPVTLDPAKVYRFMDIGEHEIVLRLIPHAGDWREAAVPRRAWELNVAPLYVNEYAHSGSLPPGASLAAVEHPGVIISVVKQAEDGEALIVRAYETCGLAATDVAIHLPLLGVSWRSDFGPGQIRTWRVWPGSEPAIQEVDLLEQPV